MTELRIDEYRVTRWVIHACFAGAGASIGSSISPIAAFNGMLFGVWFSVLAHRHIHVEDGDVVVRLTNDGGEEDVD